MKRRKEKKKEVFASFLEPRCIYTCFVAAHRPTQSPKYAYPGRPGLNMLNTRGNLRSQLSIFNMLIGGDGLYQNMHYIPSTSFKLCQKLESRLGVSKKSCL